MELSQELRSGRDSGALRPIGIKAIALGRNALDDLPGMALSLMPKNAHGSIAMLMDPIPKRRAGIDLVSLIERNLAAVGEPRRVVLESERGRVHADETTLANATKAVAGSACLVTVGSGTLADIGKAVSARLEGLPHIVVQTATSVNGFADDQSVLLTKGVKRTTPTRWPDALVADADVLVGAPVALNLAGVGDLLAMFTAPADWRLAQLLGMADSYSQTVVRIVRSHGDKVLSAAPRLADGNADAATAIAHVLTLSGISMGVAGTTAPASGMEHTVSHLIEMAMNRRGEDAAYHGAQVGVSSVVAAVLWSRVRSHLRTERPSRLGFPSMEEMDSRVRSAFSSIDPSGEMGDECWRLYSRKLKRWIENRTSLQAMSWQIVDSATTDLLADPKDLTDSLDAAGAPTRFSQLDPPVAGDLARWAIANCHLMRDRFTVADLAFFLGIWDAEMVESVLEEAASMGGGL